LGLGRRGGVVADYPRMQDIDTPAVPLGTAAAPRVGFVSLG
jgi:hypothetical protein